MVWKRMTCKGRNWASAVRLFMHGTLCSGTVYCTSLLAWPHFLSPLIHSQQNSDFWLNLDVVKCRVFLLRQLWIVNYYVKSPSNNLSNENINTGVSVAFKTKHELKCQNELFLKYNFSGNTIFMFLLLRLFDKLLT